VNNQQLQQAISLSDKERETIGWLIRGFSILETAKKMERSVPAIDKYIRQAKVKTKARSRDHLIAIVITQGLL